VKLIFADRAKNFEWNKIKAPQILRRNCERLPGAGYYLRDGGMKQESAEVILKVCKPTQGIRQTPGV
jgi:hypothetical protein